MVAPSVQRTAKGWKMAKPKKSPKKEATRIERELQLLAGTNEKSRTARCLLQISPQIWGGYQYVPPGSVLETIIREFEKKSHGPLEIPLFVTLEILATILLQKKAQLRIKGVDSPLEPMLWIFLLADSGSMKSMTFREILKWSGFNKEELLWSLNAIAGPAAFMKELAGCEESENGPAVLSKNRHLAVIEEAGEFRKKMTGAQGPLAELVSYFLMLYDHEDLCRTTKRDSIGIKEPAINLIGFSVPEPFIEGITAEEMVSGFMQRHSIIFAEPADRKRHPIIQLNLKRTAKEWKKLLASIVHQEYQTGSTAVKAFNKVYHRLMKDFGQKVPDSFSLRIMWTCHTYALLYHILLGHGAGKEICPQAYAYAERITRRALADMAKAFSLTLHSETYKKIMKAEALKERQGGKLSARDIYRHIRNINIREAEHILKIINEVKGNTALASHGRVPTGCLESAK